MIYKQDVMYYAEPIDVRLVQTIRTLFVVSIFWQIARVIVDNGENFVCERFQYYEILDKYPAFSLAFFTACQLTRYFVLPFPKPNLTISLLFLYFMKTFVDPLHLHLVD